MRYYRYYCRAATATFLLVTAYTTVTKLAGGHLAHDWLHSLLHLAGAVAGLYAGWLASSPWPARIYTIGIAVIYSALGIHGWFIDGYLLTTPAALPLGPADNVFHLLLGLSAVGIIAVAARVSTPAQP